MNEYEIKKHLCSNLKKMFTVRIFSKSILAFYFATQLVLLLSGNQDAFIIEWHLTNDIFFTSEVLLLGKKNKTWTGIQVHCTMQVWWLDNVYWYNKKMQFFIFFYLARYRHPYQTWQFHIISHPFSTFFGQCNNWKNGPTVHVQKHHHNNPHVNLAVWLQGKSSKMSEMQ